MMAMGSINYYCHSICSISIQSPLGDARVWSHATYWDGIRKKMTQFAALKEAVLWLWRVHREIVPTHEEPEFQDYKFESIVL